MRKHKTKIFEIKKKYDHVDFKNEISSLGYEGEYADTAEGLTEMTKDVASQMADDRIDEVLEKFPLVKKHLDYVLAGGESQKFMTAYDPNLDYNTMEIAEDVLAYYEKLLEVGGVEDPKTRVKIIVPENLERFPSHMSLTSILLYSPRSIKRILRFVR